MDGRHTIDMAYEDCEGKKIRLLSHQAAGKGEATYQPADGKHCRQARHDYYWDYVLAILKPIVEGGGEFVEGVGHRCWLVGLGLGP